MSLKHLVYGGSYREVCISPPHDEFTGSGIRAVKILSILSNSLKFQFSTIAVNNAIPLLKGLENSISNLSVHILPSGESDSEQALFSYLNTLAAPQCSFLPSEKPTSNELPRISANSALVFDTLEPRPIIEADIVVYDPQSPNGPRLFHDNGSTAERIAVVLNHKEALKLGRKPTLFESVKELHKSFIEPRESPYKVLVVKMAHAGCWVCTKGSILPVPAFETDLVFSIGSGDVFSTAFYKGWALDEMSPTDAARYASMVTSNYCGSGCIGSHLIKFEGMDGHSLPVVNPDAPTRQKLIYLAGPFFSQGEISFIGFLRDQLQTPWTKVFSPFHDVGLGAAEDVYDKDIQGIENADVVFALLTGMDPGTVFEVGYAVKSGKRVICLAESVSKEQLTMMIGSGAEIHTDVVTAVYRTLWATLD